jgi:CubicO group peptidase (beta-lactamase class C family)
MERATPESLGFSRARLARIGAAMQRHVDDGRLPGAATLIARRGRVVHLETVGWADVEARRPLEPDTICRIYSMTKPITVVAALLLWEEGRFGLDDPVGAYLPELAGMPVLRGMDRGVPTLAPSGRPVTIRHLMTHTAGMTYGAFEGDAPGERMYAAADLLRPDRTLAEMVSALGRLPLLFDPGSRWLYSVSIDVLGRLVEVVSGQPLCAFLQECIFGPLGMVDTGFAAPEPALGRLATLYGPAERGGLTPIPAPCGRDFARLEPMRSGGGGLVGTIVDYGRFAQMLLSGGELHGRRLLAPGTVALMRSNHLPPEAGPYGNPPHAGHGFGLGVRVLRDPGLAGQLDGVGSFGWSGLAHTDFWVDPANELVGVFMTQLVAPPPGVGAPQQFRNLAYQALVG